MINQRTGRAIHPKSPRLEEPRRGMCWAKLPGGIKGMLSILLETAEQTWEQDITQLDSLARWFYLAGYPHTTDARNMISLSQGRRPRSRTPGSQVRRFLRQMRNWLETGDRKRPMMGDSEESMA